MFTLSTRLGVVIVNVVFCFVFFCFSILVDFFPRQRERERVEEEEPEIEDRPSETRGRMSNIDKDINNKCIERNEREENKRNKTLNVSYTTKVTN